MTAPTAGSVGPEAVVIVYDPEGGFAADGGFFNSPAGALTADQSWVHGVVGSAVELQAVVAGIPGTASAAASLPPRCALASIRPALGRTAVLGDRSGVVAATANTRPRATRDRFHTASMRIGPRCMPGSDRTMNGRADPAAMVVSVRTIGLAAVAALTAAVAGCGGGSATAGSAPTPPAATTTSASRSAAAAATPTARDTCTMLTADQLASALGEPAGPGKPEPDFDTPECEWQPLSGHNGTVTLDVGPWEGDPGVKPLKLGTAVAGVGDEAYDAGNTGLYVRKGSNGLRVWVFNVSTQSSRLDLEKQLAAIVLAHI